MSVLNYRAYDEDEKEWICWTDIQYCLEINATADGHFKIENVCSGNNITIEQSTGRFDIDGVELFEGDVIRQESIFGQDEHEFIVGSVCMAVPGRMDSYKKVGTIHDQKGGQDDDGAPDV